ncbi:MAG: ribosome maturation factor RimP [Bacteroidales bacterium]|jgi:ribosome maturation factor RimP|nr:ribosome maturation factor RimP [Bacteroidales bacterium]
MINKKQIETIIDGIVKEKNAYVVDLMVNSSNKIILELDSFDGFTIDDCVDVSRIIEQNIDRDKEDFALEVSTPGLSSPFKVWQQYKKNVGQEIETILKEGNKIKGNLIDVDDEGIVIEETKKVKVEGKKKKQTIVEKHQLSFENIKSTKIVIKFK